MKVLDLHSHPSFKTIFSHQYNPWDCIPADDFLIGKIIGSQGNLSQITKNQPCNLICISLYAPETALVNQFLLKLIGPVITSALNRKILHCMANNSFDYMEEIEKEISKYRYAYFLLLYYLEEIYHGKRNYSICDSKDNASH